MSSSSTYASFLTVIADAAADAARAEAGQAPITEINPAALDGQLYGDAVHEAYAAFEAFDDALHRVRVLDAAENAAAAATAIKLFQAAALAAIRAAAALAAIR
jgi:hypothetical protein